MAACYTLVSVRTIDHDRYSMPGPERTAAVRVYKVTGTAFPSGLPLVQTQTWGGKRAKIGEDEQIRDRDHVNVGVPAHSIWSR